MNGGSLRCRRPRSIERLRDRVWIVASIAASGIVRGTAVPSKLRARGVRKVENALSAVLVNLDESRWSPRSGSSGPGVRRTVWLGKRAIVGRKTSEPRRPIFAPGSGLSTNAREIGRHSPCCGSCCLHFRAGL